MLSLRSINGNLAKKVFDKDLKLLSFDQQTLEGTVRLIFELQEYDGKYLSTAITTFNNNQFFSKMKIGYSLINSKKFPTSITYSFADGDEIALRCMNVVFGENFMRTL